MSSASSSQRAPKYITLVDEASATITYVGKAVPGTAESAAAWQIQRLEQSGSVLRVLFAEGSTGFDQAWNNRASLSYS